MPATRKASIASDRSESFCTISYSDGCKEINNNSFQPLKSKNKYQFVGYCQRREH